MKRVDSTGRFCIHTAFRIASIATPTSQPTTRARHFLGTALMRPFTKRNTTLVLVWVGILRFRMNKIRSSRPTMAAEPWCSLYIHKRTDRHRSAWVRPVGDCTADKSARVPKETAYMLSLRPWLGPFYSARPGRLCPDIALVFCP